MFSSEIFQNTYFEEHLQMAAALLGISGLPRLQNILHSSTMIADSFKKIKYIRKQRNKQNPTMSVFFFRQSRNN